MTPMLSQPLTLIEKPRPYVRLSPRTSGRSVQPLNRSMTFQRHPNALQCTPLSIPRFTELRALSRPIFFVTPVGPCPFLPARSRKPPQGYATQNTYASLLCELCFLCGYTPAVVHRFALQIRPAPTPEIYFTLCARHCWQRSPAASRHVGNRKEKPCRSNRPGMTRRLLRISSVSVLRKMAPSSSIQRIAGRPNRIPHAFRRVRINSAFGNGSGAQRFMAPSTFSCAISQ